MMKENISSLWWRKAWEEKALACPAILLYWRNPRRSSIPNHICSSSQWEKGRKEGRRKWERRRKKEGRKSGCAYVMAGKACLCMWQAIPKERKFWRSWNISPASLWAGKGPAAFCTSRKHSSENIWKEEEVYTVRPCEAASKTLSHHPSTTNILLKKKWRKKENERRRRNLCGFLFLLWRRLKCLDISSFSGRGYSVCAGENHLSVNLLCVCSFLARVSSSMQKMEVTIHGICLLCSFTEREGRRKAISILTSRRKERRMLLPCCACVYIYT